MSVRRIEFYAEDAVKNRNAEARAMREAARSKC